MNNIILLIAFVQVSTSGTGHPDFDQARQQSLETGRPLVALIGAVWCPACQQMKNSILPQVAESGGLDKVVFTYVDFDHQRELASRLSRGMSIPQLIRFDKTPTGWNSNRLIGAKDPREVYDFINAGLIEEKKVTKVSTTEQVSNNSRKAALDEPLRSTPPAVKTGTSSSVDDTRDRQWKDSSSQVERAGSTSRWIVFFKKLFSERLNRHDVVKYEYEEPNLMGKNRAAGQFPGQRKTGENSSESKTVVADVSDSEFLVP
jgi:thiol-disulfide isomerase/thioredoxin